MKTLNLIDTPANGGILGSGANNTINKRFPTPVIQSVSFYQALMPGVAGNKTPDSGNTCWPTCYGFVSYPVLFSYPDSMKRASAKNNISALTKRSNKKGTLVLLHPVFGVPVVYPRKISPSNLDITVGGRANLCVGAENTSKKRFPTPVVKSVFCSKAFTPGVAGNKTPSPGKYPLADFLRFFQLPGAFFVPGKYEERICLLTSALKKRSKKKGTQVFSAHVLGAYFTHPFNRVSVGSPSIQEVAA